jgi:hypothetical protein
MARFGGELVEDAPKPRFGGEESGAPAPSPAPVEAPPKAKSATERLKQFGEAGLGGTIMGAAAPELTQLAGKGIAMIPSPYTKAAGYGIEAAGKQMRTMRGTEAGLGGLAGMTGDIAGQAVESRGFRPPAVFAAELAGGIVGPAFAKTISEAIKYGSRKLFGIEPIKGVKLVADDLGLDSAQLSPSQRDYIKKQIDELRGGKPSSEAQETLYGALKTGAADITREAEGRAALRKSDAAIAQRQAEAQAEKMRLAGKKTTEIGAQTSKEAQAARAQIGQEREASDVGNTLRQKIMSLFGEMTEARSVEYAKQKAIRDAAVAEKESAGTFVKELPEYQALLDELRSKLLIGKEALSQKTAPVTEKGVLQAYQNIYDAVSNRRVVTGVDTNGNPNYKTFPTSFDALDDVRRRLGDAAFGKEVEGYSAIGADIARKYYGKISDIQSKFAGESHDALQGGYEAASRLLDKYKSQAGKKATAQDRFDPSRYKTDPAALPNAYFTSKQSVTDLLELTGGDRALVTQAASDFTARQLRDKDVKGVKDWLNKNSDWLESLPEVKSKVSSYLSTLERAERVSGKTGTAAKILESREPTVLRAGEKALAAGEKEAGAITAEAQKRVDTILGDTSPAKRVREIILGGKQSVWNEVGPILSRTPEGKKAISDAVLQVIAPEEVGGLIKLTKFKEDVAPFLVSSKLMTEAQTTQLETQLRAIYNSALGEPAKLNMMQNAVKNAIIGVSAQPVGGAAVSAGQAVIPKQSSSDVLNRTGSVGSVKPRF